ncbi:hypothetical protein MCP1_170031 [Candidatus Terasakiella magnetica]|nr:hypothetical protein MCP1_170031 [Candidatus Terasakiella magnetica]
MTIPAAKISAIKSSGESQVRVEGCQIRPAKECELARVGRGGASAAAAGKASTRANRAVKTRIRLQGCVVKRGASALSMVMSCRPMCGKAFRVRYIMPRVRGSQVEIIGT